MRQRISLSKSFLAILICIACILLPINPKNTDAIASAPVLVQNVQALPITLEGLNYNYIESFSDLAMDENHYFVLADDSLFVYDENGVLLASSAPVLFNAKSISLYEDLVFVVCDYEGVSSLVIYLWKDDLSLIKSISATELNGNTLLDMTIVVNAPSAHLYIVNQNGADFSFVNFEISFTNPLPSTTLQFEAGSRQCHISLKQPLLTQNSQITAVTYGKTQSSDSSGLIFVSQASVYYQAVTSSFSVKLFDEDNISDIAYDRQLDNIIYTKKNIKLRSIHDINIIKEFSDDLLLSSAQRCVVYRDKVFVSELSDSSARIYSTSTQSHSKYIIVAKSSRLGYFNSPVSASVHNQRLYVTDMLNSRVQVFDGKRIGVFTENAKNLLRPTHIAVDTDGSAYVFDSAKNSILKYNEDGSTYFEYFNPAQQFNITDMALDHNNNLYVINATDSAIYKKDVAGTFNVFESQFMSPQKLEYSRTKDFLLVLSGNKLYKHQNNTIEALNYDFTDTIVDFVLDDFDNVYVLYSNNLIEKYELNGNDLTMESAIASYSSQKDASPIRAVSLIICMSNSELMGIGDIIIVDNEAHAVRRIDKSVLNVEVYEGEASSDYSQAQPINSVVQIRTLNKQAHLFAQPNGTNSIASIPMNTSVIMLEYDLAQNSFYSLVIFTDKTKGQTITGYVLRSALSAPLTNSAPHFVNGRVLHNQTKVYKYPASFSTRLQKDGADLLLNQDDFVKLVDFVVDYKDPSGVPWVCIEVEGGFGYVSAESIIYKNYIFASTRPLPNAIITAEAVVYDESFVPLDEKPLAVGTQVTVVGRFDPRSKYTRINYYNSDYGVLDCYVETSTLQYNDRTVDETIALILFIVVVMLLFVTIVYCIRKKQQQS